MEIQLSRGLGRIGITLISLTPPHFCSCPKSGPGVQASHVIVFWVKMRGDIGGIGDHHCLNLLLVIKQSSKWKFEFTGPKQILDFIYIYNVYLNKNLKIYWSEQYFTVLGLEDRYLSWGLHKKNLRYIFIHGYRAPDKLRICVFYSMKTSKNVCIMRSECTHYAYILLCKQIFQIRSVLVQSCT